MLISVWDTNLLLSEFLFYHLWNAGVKLDDLSDDLYLYFQLVFLGKLSTLGW